MPITVLGFAPSDHRPNPLTTRPPAGLCVDWGERKKISHCFRHYCTLSIEQLLAGQHATQNLPWDHSSQPSQSPCTLVATLLLRKGEKKKWTVKKRVRQCVVGHASSQTHTCKQRKTILKMFNTSCIILCWDFHTAIRLGKKIHIKDIRNLSFTQNLSRSLKVFDSHLWTLTLSSSLRFSKKFRSELWKRWFCDHWAIFVYLELCFGLCSAVKSKPDPDLSCWQRQPDFGPRFQWSLKCKQDQQSQTDHCTLKDDSSPLPTHFLQQTYLWSLLLWHLDSGSKTLLVMFSQLQAFRFEC